MSIENIKNKIICECGQKKVSEAIEIFSTTEKPYKKAKKLVSGCNQTCCRKPLMTLFNMVQFGDIDYEMIDFLIEQKKER